MVQGCILRDCVTSCSVEAKVLFHLSVHQAQQSCRPHAIARLLTDSFLRQGSSRSSTRVRRSRAVNIYLHCCNAAPRYPPSSTHARTLVLLAARCASGAPTGVGSALGGVVEQGLGTSSLRTQRPEWPPSSSPEEGPVLSEGTKAPVVLLHAPTPVSFSPVVVKGAARRCVMGAWL